MAIKLTFNNSKYDITPACEGFWRRMAYTFTTDFKCADKIDELIRILSRSDTDEEFYEITYDFKMQEKSYVDRLLAYANYSIGWAKANLDKIREILKLGSLGDELSGGEELRFKKIRTEFYKMVALFERTWNGAEIDKLLAGKNVMGADVAAKNKSAAELKFSKTDVLKLANNFSVNCSRNLRTIQVISWIAQRAFEMPLRSTSGEEVGTTRYLDMLPALKIIGRGISAYKYIDYFLYYTYKELK